MTNTMTAQHLCDALLLTRHDLRAMRRRFYIVNVFMIGEREDYLEALEADDLETAAMIWERETGLTGP